MRWESRSQSGPHGPPREYVQHRIWRRLRLSLPAFESFGSDGRWAGQAARRDQLGRSSPVEGGGVPEAELPNSACDGETLSTTLGSSETWRGRRAPSGFFMRDVPGEETIAGPLSSEMAAPSGGGKPSEQTVEKSAAARCGDCRRWKTSAFPSSSEWKSPWRAFSTDSW